MSVQEPPADLEARFDMHGVRFVVRPTAPPTLRRRTVLAGLAAFVGGLFLLGLLVAGATLVHGPPTPWVGGLLVLGGLWCAGVFGLALSDHAQEQARLDVRIGEGWLIARVGASEILRVDLATVRRCTVVRGPDLLLHRDDGGTPTVLPMRGHDLVAVGWVAEALNAGSRDAHHGDVPVPPSLSMLRTSH